MKNFKLTFILSFIISIFMGSNVYAGQWESDRFGWSYYDDNNNFMQESWKKINNCWYHFNEDGYIQKGWFNDNGKWYYLSEENGIMLSDSITPDGYYVDSTGVWNANVSYRPSSEKAPIYSYLPQMEENNGYYKNIFLNNYWVNEAYAYDSVPGYRVYNLISDKGDYLEIDGNALSPEYLSAYLSNDEDIMDSLGKYNRYLYTGPICIKKNAVIKTMTVSKQEDWIDFENFDWSNKGYVHLTSMSVIDFLRSDIDLGFCKMKFDENGYVVEVIDLYDV